MRKFLTIVILVFSLFLFSNVNAYTHVEGIYPVFNFNPVETSDILNLTGTWQNGTKFHDDDSWFKDVGQFVYVSNVEGIYLNVSADYYFGVEMSTIYEPFTVWNNFLGSDRNTLTSDNLRCGFGAGYGAYDDSYAPTISNFSVVLENGTIDSYLHYRFHIRFNYTQQIPKFSGSSNFSCWFYSPSELSLFGQVYNPNVYTEYFGYTQRFNVTLSNDPNTEILDKITDQNDTIINNQEDIKNNTEDIKKTLNDDSIDTDQSDSFFDSFDESSDHLLTSVVLFPIKILDNLDSECRELNFPFSSDKLKFNDVSLPCGNTLFWDKPKVAEFKKFWNFIVGAPIIYGCLLWTFKTIQKLKNPFDNEVEMIEL